MRRFVPVLLFLLLLPLSAHAQELVTEYFTISLPDGWQAIKKPTESQGMTSAVLAKSSGTVTVALVVGPRNGADAKTIAALFAGQFKAEKAPVDRGNGQYSFNFSQQQMNCQAWVGTQDDFFMVVSLLGNPKEALAFVKKHIRSTSYPKLLPQ